MQETTDIATALLAMTSEESEENDAGKIEEEQYISKMLASLSTNDLRSFKKHLEDNYDEIESDISSIKYSYGIEPNIYAIDATEKIAKLNPSNLFSSAFGGTSSMMTSFSSSTYSQMIDDKELLNNSYDILAGRWPENYDEMIIVLSERGSISDFLIYQLGLRDTEELSDIVKKIMSGEKAELYNEPMTLTYDDLMNIELKLIIPTDKYKYNTKYDIYEDMSENEDFMKELYNNATPLKIVGVVTAKEGVTTMALNPGVSYTSKLIDHIIDYSAGTDIVKKQKENTEVDVISGKRFDEKNKINLDFKDLISVDSKKLESAFNVKVDQNAIQKETEGYMGEISNSVTTDITPAKKAFKNNLNTFAKGLFDSIKGTISVADIEDTVYNYLEGEGQEKAIAKLEADYVIPKDVYKNTYAGLLSSMLQVYVNSYYTMDKSLTKSPENPTAIVIADIVNPTIETYLNNPAIEETSNQMAKAMTEALMKKTILTKVGELTSSLTGTFASAFNVDQGKIASSFKLKMSQEEITRIISAMITKNESNAETNLIALGYKDKEEPTYISFYFKSFDGKERFMNFIDKYNESAKANGEDDKEINYTDTTGILMGSVKTIVNAVTYVLIAFISISLVVSSIMIGIITYISVYERTKEIGILRAIGASKHNISSIFNAETFIIGLLSGLFGIGTTYALIPPINSVLHTFTGNIPLNATFYFNNAIILVILSVVLTLIGGLIPARAASKKDPVIALRTE